MDNLKLPAYPVDWNDWDHATTRIRKDGPMAPFSGFTKIELASLMAMQGMLSSSLTCDQGVRPFHTYNPEEMAPLAIQYAKAVLEEANK